METILVGGYFLGEGFCSPWDIGKLLS